ncbi:olfactory receptor 6M1-like [Hyperolius riggenbachi]|uniref:olfactory receptor 6M1-like n=1 Tax=Hyperolius riggenbachi TaxID=752182 RepID=UPI0035A2AFA2
MWDNYTAVTEIIFEGFPEVWAVSILLFVLLLLLYIVTLLGNFFVIFLVCKDLNLHGPMYFFLANFAFVEMALAFVITPNVLSNLLSMKKGISFAGCFAQSYCFFLQATTDLILIATMSYDRYLAICHPLHYTTTMTGVRCVLLVLGSWFGAFLSLNTSLILKLQLPFCGPNKINHFFCDSAPLMELVCIETKFIQILDFLLFSAVILGTLIYCIFSYTCILLTIFRIPSASGRQKAFSTCSSHFTIMTIVYSSSIFMYVSPRHRNSVDINKVISAVNIFIVPVANPFIFTLRNKQVKDAMFKVIKKFNQ